MMLHQKKTDRKKNLPALTQPTAMMNCLRNYFIKNMPDNDRPGLQLFIKTFKLKSFVFGTTDALF
jgi:hypothetical protein